MLSTKRHSMAHILAQAVQNIFGNDVKLGIGPEIEDGFYYDFDFGEKELSEENFKEIEKKMKNIMKQNQKFQNFSMKIDEAISFLEKKGEIYKVILAKNLKEKGEKEIGFYENLDQKGERVFFDMCKGPHISQTKELDQNCFKLDKIAGAYFLGTEKNKQLTRIYVLAFENKEKLDEKLKQISEAKKRDHRILGKKLNLFTISPLIGAGLPLLQPAGMILRNEIENYLWELHSKKGYEKVWTPHIGKIDLYETSGHAQKFGDELFKVSGKEENFILKPMNCPHHMQIFADNHFSYRDMPVRYFEPATVYRDEKSGQLSGLTRVRAITQDDGHIFCRISQIKDEVQIMVEIIKEFYKTMGMMDSYWVSLSVRDDDKSKYLGSDEVWEKAESALENISKEIDLPYKKIEGEAAFYGPKLDFMFKDAIGREWQLATIQCDFNLPEKFDLSFINEENEKERPVVIHRAICGSLERCMGVLIEHFAGIFPLWLAPKQITIIPVAETFLDYSQKIFKKLREKGFRVSLDSSSFGLSKKVRNAEKMHINYILVLGEKEEKEGKVSARNYKTKEQEELSLEDFVKKVGKEIDNKDL